MRHLSVSVATFCTVLCSASALLAQTATQDGGRFYLGGSASVVAQPAGKVDRDFEANGVGGASAAVAAVFGTRLHRDVAVEAEVSFQTPIDARQVRGLREFTTIHRDVITSVLAIFGQHHEHRVTVQGVGGVSIASGSTRLTEVQQFLTFCPEMVRHCAVAAHDQQLSEHLYFGVGGGLHAAVPLTPRSAFTLSVRFDHLFGREHAPSSLYDLGLPSEMFRVGTGMRFAF